MKKHKEHIFQKNNSNFAVPVSGSPVIPVNNPFENLERILPVNVVSTTDLYMRTLEIIKSPSDHYKDKGLLVGDALEFGRQNTKGRYKVETLAKNAKNLFSLELTELYFNGQAYKFDGWIDALVSVSKMLAQQQMDSFDDLDVSRLIDWVEPMEANLSRGEALAQGKANIHLMSKHQVCACLQIMFLVCGIPLNQVAVRYNAYTDDAWAKEEKIIAEKAKAKLEQQRLEEERRLKAVKKAERRKRNAALEAQKQKKKAEQEARREKEREETIAKLIPLADTDSKVIEKLAHLGVKRCPTCRQWFRTKNYEYMRHVATCGKPSSGDRKYIIENGLVVFIGDDTEPDGRILRSEDDGEDTWRGMGNFARDNGRFGIIDGVDYAE